MNERWFREAVIYCLDVETFQDSNGDGIGDLPGLIGRLDYLERLGVTCLWLNPIHPTPNRDDGYDVADFYGVDPRLGNLGDFVELVHQAANRGLRVMIDLVVNHTSDQHPWFQAARSDPTSPFRDYYVWSDERPTDLHQGMVFPGVQKATWTFDRTAKAWYYHRFYDFEPELNAANPRVRAEVQKIIAFWLQMGVAGFRMDAAPFVIEMSEPNNANPPKDFDYLRQLRELMSWRRGDTLVLAEANAEPQELTEYFGGGDRVPMLFNFLLNQQMFLAMARGDAGPVLNGLTMTPPIPDSCAWATFLRNHDEIDLGRLTGVERAEVFEAFGPEPEMQIYDRGIRRRLAPMLGGDRRRLEMAYILQFCLPGTPVIRYGEEIGMGDDLSLPERNSVRTPMQWSAGPNAGFSTAAKKDLARPVIGGGRFGFQKVNVAAQRRDHHSLVSWMERTLHTLHECPEFGTGQCEALDSEVRSVLALRHEAASGVMLALINLADETCVVDLADQLGELGGEAVEVLGDADYGDATPDPSKLELNGLGYRWIRLARSPGAS